MAAVCFLCTCRETHVGESVCVIGADETLGSWGAAKAIPLTTTAETFPEWKSPEIHFRPEGSGITEYKYIIRRSPEQVRWEPIGGNRSLSIQRNHLTTIRNNWGDPNLSTMTYEPLTVSYDNNGSGGGAFSSYNDAYGHHGFRPGTGEASPECHPDPEASRFYGAGLPPPAGEPANERPLTPRRGHTFQREAFILANTGPMTRYYRMTEKVGQGTWGSVHEVVNKATGMVRAAKKIPKCYVEDIDRFRQEIDIMKSLDHPNIVRLYETFEDPTDIYLVMEMCQGGELFDRLLDEGTFTEEDAARLLRQILSAIQYCHNCGVAHRDLKPENFLFLKKTKDSPIKLIDFGLATRFTTGEPMRTRAGTPYYVSPQVLEGRYGPECDVWSAGVMMYILLCGYPPFNGPSDAEIMQKVKIGKFQFPEAEWQQVSNEAKDLITKLLTRHPKYRITADEALQHPWFHAFTPENPAASRPLGFDILAKFRRFQGLSRMKKIALTVIAQQMSDNDIETLKEAFMMLDKRGNGKLTAAEIREGIMAGGMRQIPADFEKILQDVDTAATGTVDYTEFLAACLNQSHYIQEEACRAAFRVFDIDGNGRISKDELRQVIHMAGAPGGGPMHNGGFSPEEGDFPDTDSELFEGDWGQDGEIGFDQFVQIMRKVPSQALLAPEETVSMMKKVPSRSSVATLSNANLSSLG
ncbi:unnamed protein product [Vitrella brassicaformis CCMP3155]|uniref:Calcium-dependent protein kinase 1 n=2 Tax=Vitrella brassicaformis TaxID=1169539 RepID=A0A0G4EVY6_VITBC|nr:unnamed protein product [Vitrella brassicaformis CCMP3155]|mmetsp:Transcript_27764/g.69270  ORF Transcript_27764/g.69270 Transcript_27764/m.69270 type:complete len:695 (+) Transcript_27764:197-2281(+)|eukprot:CEM02372.1 unnamed protein product [Vitrella brassicaformis CCMP3155]